MDYETILTEESDGVATVRLADSGHTGFAGEFKDRTQRIRRMQTVRTPQRRIGNSDRVHAHLDNLHGIDTGTINALPILIEYFVAGRNRNAKGMSRS